MLIVNVRGCRFTVIGQYQGRRIVFKGVASSPTKVKKMAEELANSLVEVAKYEKSKL